jgi:hypothetical protein
LSETPVLVQRKGFRTRTYTLSDEEVIVRVQGLVLQRENRIPYAFLSTERFENTVTNKAWLLPGGLFLIFGLLVVGDRSYRQSADAVSSLLFYLTLAALCGVAYLMSRQRYVGYQAGRVPLAFWAARPSEEALQEFITEVQVRKQDFMRRNFLARRSGGSAADELQKLAWLKGSGTITEKEFEILKHRIIFGTAGSEEEGGSVH